MGLRRPPKKSAQTLSADAYTPVYMEFCYFVGGVTSPCLANVFLHHVLDEWFVKEVKPRMRGHCFIVRFADGTPVQA